MIDLPGIYLHAYLCERGGMKIRMRKSATESEQMSCGVAWKSESKGSQGAFNISPQPHDLDRVMSC